VDFTTSLTALRGGGLKYGLTEQQGGSSEGTSKLGTRHFLRSNFHKQSESKTGLTLSLKSSPEGSYGEKKTKKRLHQAEQSLAPAPPGLCPAYLHAKRRLKPGR